MATKIPIPKLGQSEETVTIENWHVKEGDIIKKGDVLFDVETDKSVLEVESQFEGTLLKIIIPAGKEVPVMSIAAVVGEQGEDIPEIEQPAPAAAAKPAAPPKVAPAKPVPEPVSKPETALPVVSAAPETVAAPAKPLKPSPRARKFAADYLIDLNMINGTGGNVGRVTEKDVREYLESSGYMDRKITPAAFNVAKKEELYLLDIQGSGDGGRVTLADVRDAVAEKPQEFPTMRRLIAERLTKSKQQVPHFYVTCSIDMSDLLRQRKEMKQAGFAISVNVFIIKAVADALKDFPMLNASTDGRSISHRSKINIGVAVSLKDGLVVPVVKRADSKELDEIQAEVAELADKARNNKLLPEDMQGGSFTISNMGMLNVDNFAAIINPGETGILAVSSTIPTPVVKNGEIQIRDMMKITLSADHRAVDGAEGARFVNALKKQLESPDWKF